MYRRFTQSGLVKTAILLLLLCYQATSYAEQKLYVINIASSQGKFTAKDLPNIKNKQSYRFYTVKLESRNAIWNRLRLGFFTSKTEALGYLKSISNKYPDAFLGLVSERELNIRKRRKFTAAFTRPYIYYYAHPTRCFPLLPA